MQGGIILYKITILPVRLESVTALLDDMRNFTACDLEVPFKTVSQRGSGKIRGSDIGSVKSAVAAEQI